jgi:hypothetical protein
LREKCRRSFKQDLETGGEGRGLREGRRILDEKYLATGREGTIKAGTRKKEGEDVSICVHDLSPPFLNHFKD